LIGETPALKPIAFRLIIAIEMITDSCNDFLLPPKTMVLINKLLQKLNIEQGTPILDL